MTLTKTLQDSTSATHQRVTHFGNSAIAIGLFCALLLAGCGEVATLRPGADTGPSPSLVSPVSRLIPTVQIATAVGWPQGDAPLAVVGTQVAAFARDLDHPRWLHVLPNGDVLVAETNAPTKPEDGFSIKAWVTRLVMQRAGASGVSADRITLLRDTDGDGVADLRTVLIDGLHSPFGMALVGQNLYVANADAVLRFHYTEGDTRLQGPSTQLTSLPGGPLNHHWTKNLIASPDGRSLYVAVGSNSNVAEHGMAIEAERAAIWQVNVATGEHRIFASGLRNPVGMAWERHGSTLWVVVNERDELGSDLVPDYLTAVREGEFYGWPYSYYGAHVDTRVSPQRPDLVAQARSPDYALGAHTASLGLTSSEGTALPATFAHGMFVGQHGSWNRNPRSGYKVVFVAFANGRPLDSPPIDVLTGFLTADGKAKGRPVGVALDKRGALLVADDVGNVIWRVTAKPLP